MREDDDGNVWAPFIVFRVGDDIYTYGPNSEASFEDGTRFALPYEITSRI